MMGKHLRNKVTRFLTLVCITVATLTFTEASSVYMDKYGDCTSEYITVEGEAFALYAHGEGYRATICRLTFKASKGNRLCLYSKFLKINDCSVSLQVFDGSDHLEAKQRYSCNDDEFSSMCSTGRYLSILLVKQNVNSRDYDFVMEIEEMTSGDEFAISFNAFFLSVGVIVAIIIGVIILIIILAVVIVCCCCKQSPRRRTNYTPTATQPSVASAPVEPTAPPCEPLGQPRYQSDNNGKSVIPGSIVCHGPEVPSDPPPPYPGESNSTNAA